ncbi:protein transport protein bet1 [Malassezia furfur]|uniref:Protein transport protein bet1 n=1 Tax=Malassezia furfur TaxID=55194 RepID=A0ABY8EMI0_MALFU|nr:protein transport protein bet1 [Malassezia furfur]
MSRRTAAAPDRHALLTGHAYPSSSSVRVASPAVTEYNTPLRTASPYENPYGDMQGAPKKEASSSSGFVSLFQGTAAQQRSAADLEEQNDTRLNALSERIKMLKDISMGIGNEVRESTSEMNSLNDVFSNASALLGSTFSRMNAMARRQKGWFCNMMLFILLVIWIFVFLWWWRR